MRDRRRRWAGLVAVLLNIGNTSMTGKCLRNAPFGVYLQRPGEPGVFYTLAEGTTLGDGMFQVAHSMTLLAGDRIRLICATPAGDHAILDRTFGFT
jgi:hypothetical protein